MKWLLQSIANVSIVKRWSKFGREPNNQTRVFDHWPCKVDTLKMRKWIGRSPKRDEHMWAESTSTKMEMSTTVGLWSST